MAVDESEKELTDEQIQIEKQVENYKKEAEELRCLLQNALVEERNSSEQMTPDERMQVWCPLVYVVFPQNVEISLFIIRFQIVELEFEKLSQKTKRVISEGDGLIAKIQSFDESKAQNLKSSVQAVLRNLWSQYLTTIEVDRTCGFA